MRGRSAVSDSHLPVLMIANDLLHIGLGEASAVQQGIGHGLDGRPVLRELPPWLTEQDIDAYVTQYARAGFTGPINWYRNWELTALWQHTLIDVPALFIAGDRDPNLRTISPAGIAAFLPKLTKSLMLPGCGH